MFGGRWFSRHCCYARKAVTGTPDEEEASKKPEFAHPVVIVRNSPGNSPNLSLNGHNTVGRGELYLVAAVAVILQLAVLAYAGVAAYHFRSVLLKDDNLVQDYAFPCTAIGTLLLVLGLLMCAYIVESSTAERRYCHLDGMELRLVWLQKYGTVNDQAFDSFAIFPETPQPLVTTSHRAESFEARDTKKTKTGLALFRNVREAITLSGTVISLCGFVVQFTGLRGMHWSVSIAQLVAILIMTILRAIIRRHLANHPKAESLVPDYELDWLTLNLAMLQHAPWQREPEHEQREGNNLKSREDDPKHTVTGHSTRSRGWDWKICELEDPETREMVRFSDENRPIFILDDIGMLQDVVSMRRILSRLTAWVGPAAAEAVSLARAIEVTMDALYPPDFEGQEAVWPLTATGASTQMIHSQSTFEFRHAIIVGKPSPTSLKLRFRYGSTPPMNKNGFFETTRERTTQNLANTMMNGYATKAQQPSMVCESWHQVQTSCPGTSSGGCPRQPGGLLKSKT
jgi:hypothetical protein